ncbi:hypothetical protein TUM20985_21270 [Mycobacterium antarcticum]|uniref:class I SAM-dependent methyltransferase n=1 Tax=Mycolicibacterium sp. TUM20985 TaxID=3023370 RepID=UPI002574637D|nr:class I SAM-dependent methyltransferase [Mycolicibacterium sp. TUM20985]BDX31580.1 hypothetical protein TUM20985_21270 [Mycolicibacterium sp. TUM20985]
MLSRSCPIPAERKPSWSARYLSRQAAQPSGAFGWLLGRIWLAETAEVNDVALELLAPAHGERVCEIGFGPGRTLTQLAAAGADVVGVEVSGQMLAVAGRRNADPIAAGNMSLHCGDGTTLPLPDDSLDAVLSVHNVYFWPHPGATLADIARTLRTGGRLVLTSLADDHPLPERFDPTIYRVPTIADTTSWLHSAGFVDVGIHRRPHIPTTVWFTATAT